MLLLINAIGSLSFAEVQGEWEGQLMSPRRPVVMNLNFTEKTARMDATGSQALPVQDLSIEEGEISFAIPVRGEIMKFRGNISGGQISGSLESERKTPFALERLPVLPKAADRVQAWIADIDVVLSRFLKYDRSYSGKQRNAAAKALTELKASAIHLNDEELIVGLSRAIALSGNAHTRIYLLRNRTELRRLPLRFWWFSDGLYVIKSTPEHKNLLGCRITAIGGKDPRNVRKEIGTLMAGNESWLDYMSVYFATSPEILKGLHLIPNAESIELTLSCNNKPRKQAIVPMELAKKEKPTEAWWDLTPHWKPDDGPWQQVLDSESTPLYLRNPAQYYWFEFLPTARTLYFQYNRSQNMPSGETLEQFGVKLLAELDKPSVKKLVVDLRFNTGGDLGIARTLMQDLILKTREKKIPVYVLMGRATFSAGISHAVQWKESGQAVFIGENAGDELDTWSEGGNIVLPNSGLTVHYTNGFHSNSKIEYPEFQPYYMDNNAENLNIDLPVPLSGEDYLNGKDPVLDAAKGQPPGH